MVAAASCCGAAFHQQELDISLKLEEWMEQIWILANSAKENGAENQVY